MNPAIVRAARAFVLAAVTVTTAFTATAEAATPGQVTAGTGWKLAPTKTTSLVPGTYLIEFDSTTARTKLTPYLKLAAANLQAQTPGVKFTVTTTIQKRVTTGCQKYRTIVASLEYRPAGKAGFSFGGNCFNTADQSLWSGYMRYDTEIFQAHWFSKTASTNTYRVRNNIAHELGHGIGLEHPNKDLNHDGVIRDYECSLNTDKVRPLLCSPNGGWVNSKAGSYTPLDVKGIKALVANYQYR